MAASPAGHVLCGKRDALDIVHGDEENISTGVNFKKHKPADDLGVPPCYVDTSADLIEQQQSKEEREASKLSPQQHDDYSCGVWRTACLHEEIAAGHDWNSGEPEVFTLNAQPTITVRKLAEAQVEAWAACMGGNAVPYSLGAGAGSKGASMYQARAPRRLPRAARARRSPCSHLRAHAALRRSLARPPAPRAPPGRRSST